MASLDSLAPINSTTHDIPTLTGYANLQEWFRSVLTYAQTHHSLVDQDIAHSTMTPLENPLPTRNKPHAYPHANDNRFNFRTHNRIPLSREYERRRLTESEQ